MAKDTYLLIPDLQIPFEAPKALAFAIYIKRHFKVPLDNILCVGDETDQHFGGLYKISPNALHTPGTEIAESISKLKEWYAQFPKCKVAISNHGTRWVRKALNAEIPSQLLRDYREVISAPPGWIWKEKWIFNDGKRPFQMIHGMGYSGPNGHRNAAIDVDAYAFEYGKYSRFKPCLGIGLILNKGTTPLWIPYE